MVQESGRGELESFETEIIETYRKKQQGVVPLVIEVDSLDIMANLLRMKLDVEDKIGSRMRMVFSGVGTDLLAVYYREECERDEGCRTEHSWNT